ncbi:EpsG family protein [Mitsuokella sp. UBA4253]|uniref:EpsG family protein n=1 Tax=Mitsuokella sp. UBA4253 TaxID=1946959 RepID=UPI00257D7A54|nr:EpsG family protein [Mitsuokella sp. UBA4253]
MEFYYILFFITVSVSFLSLTNLSHEKKNLAFFSLIILYIFLSATRWNNPDWIVYYPFFEDNFTLDQFTSGQIDPGFGVVNWLVKSVMPDFSALLTVLAIVIIGIFALFMYKFSPYPLISLLYWFGTYTGEIFFNRQSLAIAITLLAFPFIVRRKMIPFVLITILAATIQVSVIGFLLAYPIYHLKFKGRYLILILVAGIVIGQFLDIKLMLTVASLVQIIDINQERLLDKIDLYYMSGASAEEEAGMLISSVRRLIFVPIEIFFIEKISKNNPYYRGCVNLTLFGYSLFFLLKNVSPTVATRVSSPFYMYEIIVIPMIFTLARNFWVKILFFVVIAVYSFAKYIYGINLYEDILVPYTNVLFGDIQ